MNTLRPFQLLAGDHALDFLRTAQRGQKQLYKAPTGVGKSYVERYIQDRAPGTWIVSPSEEILDGMLEKAGLSGDPLLHNMCTPIRLRNRLVSGAIQPPEFIIYDEAHHSGAETWQQVDLLTGLAPAVGFTATDFCGSPRATRELKDTWGESIEVISYEEAEHLGYISMPTWEMLPLVDDDLIEVTNGEFVVDAITSAYADRLGSLAQACNDRWLTDGIWDRTTVFSFAGSKLCNLFAQMVPGVKVVVADTPRNERRDIFERFKRRECAIAQVRVVSEGVDLPVRRIVDCAPCMSPRLWVQMIGRCTRPVHDGETKPEVVCTCLAEGTPIMTDRGFVSVEQITADDLLWDGEEWVSHGGIVCNGLRKTIDVRGVRMTPDHMVLTTEGWRQACQLDDMSTLNPGRFLPIGQLSNETSLGMNAGGVYAMSAVQQDQFQNDFLTDHVRTTANMPSVEHAEVGHPMVRRERISISRSNYASIFGERQDRQYRGPRDLEDTYTRNGSKTGQNLSPILRPSRGMPTKNSHLTVLITKKDTSPETYGLSRTKTSSLERNSNSTLSVSQCSTRDSNKPLSNYIRNSPQEYRSGVRASETLQTCTVFREAASETSYVGISAVITNNSCRQRVFDILDAGPRNRFQAGSLIVHNCRNLMRHAHVLKGCIPFSSLVQAEKTFGFSERTISGKVIGLESIGRLKPSTAKTRSGLTFSIYCMSSVNGLDVTDYAALAHPSMDPVWAIRKHKKKEDGTRDWGKWVQCDPPADLKGFSSLPGGTVSEKQLAWWQRSASRLGLDETVVPTRKNFAVLPFLMDLNLRLT